MSAQSTDVLLSLVREAINALRDKALSPEEGAALLSGLADVSEAIVDLIPSWWGKAVCRVFAQVCREAAEQLAGKTDGIET
jgi:hypothetical protein